MARREADETLNEPGKTDAVDFSAPADQPNLSEDSFIGARIFSASMLT